MVPTDATIQGNQVCLLIVQVQTRHLSSCQTLTATTETATAATKAHIIHVVGTGHEECLEVILHQTTEDTAAITILGTCSQVGIEHDTFIHTCLDTKVEHGFLLTIVNTTDASQVALLVISSYALDNVCWQVLHGSFRIARHKLLTINLNLLYLFTVDGNLTVVINLSTRQTLYQFLYDRTLWCTVGRSIIYKGVGLDYHLRRITSNRGTFQHDSIGLQLQRTHGDIFVVGNSNTFRIWFKTYTRYLQDVFACLWC